MIVRAPWFAWAPMSCRLPIPSLHSLTPLSLWELMQSHKSESTCQPRQIPNRSVREQHGIDSHERGGAGAVRRQAAGGGGHRAAGRDAAAAHDVRALAGQRPQPGHSVRRFLANPEVTATEMLATAGRLTGERAAGRHVLAIEDTTELHFPTHAASKRGFGKGGNGTDLGLFLHAVLAVDAENAGIVAQFLRAGDYVNLHASEAFTLITVVLSNLVSNVPAAMLLKYLVPGFPDPHRAWLLLAMASTLAGNLTITGSVANIIVVETAKPDLHIGFRQYFRAGLPVTLGTLLIGWAWLRFA